MDNIDLNLLVPLDALLQEGSVSRAARCVGLSTPAMSHALARLHERLGDALLVRSGRGMVLTPRALELRVPVRTVVAQARATLAPERPFVAHALSRTFVVHVTDYVLDVMGGTIDRILREEAPDACVRFVPNTPDDAGRLRDDGSDLAVGIYGNLPQEMRICTLLTDRFVCVVRRAHPIAGRQLTLEAFLALRHVQVAPRGQPGGYIDDLLRARGEARVVARAVPYFLTALQMVAETDYLLTVSERIARAHAEALGLMLLEPPIPLRPYALSLVWHPRVDGDPANRFLRDVLSRAASEVAGERHDGPRRHLDASDPTSGQARRRLLRPPIGG